MATGFIAEQLNQGEEIIHEGKTHPLSVIVPMLWCCILVGFLKGKHKAVIDYFTAEIAVTNRRLIGKRGLISIETMDLQLQKVSALEVKQGVIGRILDYGTLYIATDGYHRHVFHGVIAPYRFRKIFNDALENRRS